MIAEDEESNFQLLFEILLPTNVKVARANNGKEVISIFECSPKFDLILLDIKMPIMDGLETAAYIRKKDREIPIIAQTVFGTAMFKDKGYKAGFNEFIIKPIVPDKFRSKLAVYLND